jgi:hypothetical protein
VAETEALVKFNVWRTALPAGVAVDEEPPVEGAVRNGELIEDGYSPIPLWEVEVPDIQTLLKIVDEGGGSIEISTRDAGYPHPELILP